jgi:hypothetical protein
MSKYHKIKTEILNPESLLSALADMHIKPTWLSDDLRRNGTTLMTHWETFGGRNQQVAISVDRSVLINAGYDAMDGIGFAWNGNGYDLLADHYDEVKPWVGKLKQRYTLHEAKRLARLQGYTLTETTMQDGSIRLTCSQY